MTKRWVLSFVVVGAVAGHVWGQGPTRSLPAADPVSAAASAHEATLRELSAAFERITARVSPSVVQVFTTGWAVGSGPSSMLARQQGLGSGVIVDPDGYIVTNAHVVAGARRIRVQLLVPAPPTRPNGPTQGAPVSGSLEATVVGVDVPTDVAVLKVAATDLPALTLGDSDRLHQGQIVLAIGSPLGLGNTVTMGIVSAVARQLHPDDPRAYVQTDAPINPGNSGGPLLDAEGRVIGISTMIVTQSGGSEGLGLAIPSNTVRDIYAQIRAEGKVRRGVIGIQAQTVTPVMAAGLRLAQAWGAIVSDVAEGGPADKAGVKVGDIIVRTDGRTIENVKQLGTNLYRHKIDATVAIELLRGTDRLTLKVPVIERPDDPTRFLDFVDPSENLVPQLDILGITLTDKVAATMSGLRESSGVLVAAVAADATSEVRFQPGDVIHAVNGARVVTLEELRAAVADLKDGDPCVVQIEQAGSLAFVAFEVD